MNMEKHLINYEMQIKYFSGNKFVKIYFQIKLALQKVKKKKV